MRPPSRRNSASCAPSSRRRLPATDQNKATKRGEGMNSATTAESSVANERAPNQWLVIGASSLGTVFEWYDFYIYGLLATILTTQFFSGVNEVTGFIFALA